MKPILGIVIAMLLSTSGCFVRTRPGPGNNSARTASCPPAHHYEGGVCVHNGNGRGNGNGNGRGPDKVRDHRQ
ncbi:MAG: hypothetical protein ABI175_15650 [Polyangiales bacterium]